MFELTFPFAIRGQVAAAPKFHPVPNNPWRRAGFSFAIEIPQATLGVALVPQRSRRIYLSTEGKLAESIADCELMVNERLLAIVADIDSLGYRPKNYRPNPQNEGKEPIHSMPKFIIIAFKSLTRPELWGAAPGNEDLTPYLVPDLNRVAAA
ncbi:hypothetical protein BJF79_07300 [Actinomadura sp. CNU-125]|uniref:hypothetical protein n=1 Tax=Actinomadura sp. CNU-125 TaxID=1904961 RepID=UPI000959C5F0|nr:hypothetical protein [Actinomadura sp. CNU-125]OLT34368.1 hypothetical protein BJF79_07300 [Actinomadura sp. CNU-125]